MYNKIKHLRAVNTAVTDSDKKPSLQLSSYEQMQIASQIKADLIEHLYKSTTTGVITGFLSSVSIFCYFYLELRSVYLIWWLIAFNVALLFIVAINELYKNNKCRFSNKVWETLFVYSVIVCSILWGSTVFFITDNIISQYLLIGLLVMVSSAYSTGTVGIFYLSAISISFVLLPITTWLLLQDKIYYNFVGALFIFYLSYLLGMSRRSAEWFINSLRLKIENSHFTHQANYDFLTNLPNNRLLLQYIENAINNYKTKNVKFALICFSVNKMEMFNSSLGYQASDIIIKSLTARIKAHLDWLAKNSKQKSSRILTLPRSDTFVMLFEVVDTEIFKQEVASLFYVLKQSFGVLKGEATLTASIGVCIYPNNCYTASDILSNAQASMFKAKQFGGNRIEYYTKEINEKTPWRLELEHDLHHAIQRQELVTHYQPIVDIKTGKITEAEALIRWRHPKHGMISPIEFISLAEETGLIIPIGEWVLEQACYHLARMHRIDPNLKISVNISVKQLHYENIFAIISRVLQKTKIASKYLDLELTETEILDERLVPILRKIIDMGVLISIDDFGTGYSGMNYLRMFRADKIKIDKTFTQEINRNKDNEDVIAAIIAMSKELGIKVLAEGVETKEQLQFLVDRKCEYVQGYYYSKPVASDAFAQLLIKYNTAKRLTAVNS